jgi:hypothetical protein
MRAYGEGVLPTGIELGSILSAIETEFGPVEHRVLGGIGVLQVKFWTDSESPGVEDQMRRFQYRSFFFDYQDVG